MDFLCVQFQFTTKLLNLDILLKQSILAIYYMGNNLHISTDIIYLKLI